MAELMKQTGLPAPEIETAAGEDDACLLKSCGLAKYAQGRKCLLFYWSMV
jgi:hypothetical protein